MMCFSFFRTVRSPGTHLSPKVLLLILLFWVYGGTVRGQESYGAFLDSIEHFRISDVRTLENGGVVGIGNIVVKGWKTRKYKGVRFFRIGPEARSVKARKIPFDRGVARRIRPHPEQGFSVLAQDRKEPGKLSILRLGKNGQILAGKGKSIQQAFHIEIGSVRQHEGRFYVLHKGSGGEGPPTSHGTLDRILGITSEGSLNTEVPLSSVSDDPGPGGMTPVDLRVSQGGEKVSFDLLFSFGEVFILDRVYNKGFRKERTYWKFSGAEKLRLKDGGFSPNGGSMFFALKQEEHTFKIPKEKLKAYKDSVKKLEKTLSKNPVGSIGKKALRPAFRDSLKALRERGVKKPFAQLPWVAMKPHYQDSLDKLLQVLRRDPMDGLERLLESPKQGSRRMRRRGRRKEREQEVESKTISVVNKMPVIVRTSKDGRIEWKKRIDLPLGLYEGEKWKGDLSDLRYRVHHRKDLELGWEHFTFLPGQDGSSYLVGAFTRLKEKGKIIDRLTVLKLDAKGKSVWARSYKVPSGLGKEAELLKRYDDEEEDPHKFNIQARLKNGSLVLFDRDGTFIMKLSTDSLSGCGRPFELKVVKEGTPSIERYSVEPPFSEDASGYIQEASMKTELRSLPEE